MARRHGTDSSCQLRIAGQQEHQRILEEFVGQDMPVDTLLIDELPCLKADSNRTKAVPKARKQFKRVHGLTGTPRPNGLMDLVFQLKVLDGGTRLGRCSHRFKSRWFDRSRPYEFTPKAHAHDEAVIADICLARHFKEHLDIPDCKVIDVDVTLPARVVKQYKALERHLVVNLHDTLVTAPSAAVLVNKLMQLPPAASTVKTARPSTFTPPSTPPLPRSSRSMHQRWC